MHHLAEMVYIICTWIRPRKTNGRIANIFVNYEINAKGSSTTWDLTIESSNTNQREGLWFTDNTN